MTSVSPVLFMIITCAALVVGCSRPTHVLPGLLVTADGSIVEATPQAARQDREQRLAMALGPLLPPAYGVSVAIAENPSQSGRMWTWQDLNGTLTITGDGSQPAPDIETLTQRAAAELRPHAKAEPMVKVVTAGSPAAIDKAQP